MITDDKEWEQVLIILDGVRVLRPDGTETTMDPPFVCMCGKIHARIEAVPIPARLRMERYPSEGAVFTHAYWCPDDPDSDDPQLLAVAD